MPETMSVERRKIIQAYGAELVLTPGSEGMKVRLQKRKKLLLNAMVSYHYSLITKLTQKFMKEQQELKF